VEGALKPFAEIPLESAFRGPLVSVRAEYTDGSGWLVRPADAVATAREALTPSPDMPEIELPDRSPLRNRNRELGAALKGLVEAVDDETQAMDNLDPVSPYTLDDSAALATARRALEGDTK
jgi:hypothetical protein